MGSAFERLLKQTQKETNYIHCHSCRRNRTEGDL